MVLPLYKYIGLTLVVTINEKVIWHLGIAAD